MPTELLYGSKTAAISWTDGGVQQRAYFQDLNGQIREAQRAGDNPWTGGLNKNVVGKGKLFTPLAAVSWNSSSGRQIRVYYLTENNILSELVYDGSWHSGGLDSFGLKAASNSKLAAIQWGGSTNSSPEIRVYYQKSNDSGSPIYEHAWSSGWKTGSSFGSAAPGTSIGATVFGLGKLRIYYQGPDNTIREQAWDSSSWYVGQFSARAPDSASITAISWGSTPHIRVYWQKGAQELSEAAFDGGWANPAFIQDASHPTPSLPATHISSTAWGEINIRVFFQGAGVTLQEWQWVPNRGWSLGAEVPTGTPKGW
jgi:hypothetical protein